MSIDLLALGLPALKRRRDHDWLPPVGLGGGQVTFAWQFQPETYGAVGNGRVTGDVTSNGTTTYTSPTVAADASAVGKYIMIHGANGVSSGPVIGTITSVNAGANTFTVSGSAAAASVSNCPAVWGTDDTAAINTAITNAATYATTFGSQPGSGGYFAEILFGAKIYILGTGPTQVGNGSSLPTFNTQIQMPFPAANGTSQKLVIILSGAGDSGYAQFWDSLIPNLSGTCLVSMLTTSSTPSATFGQQSVIGGPSGSAGFTTPAGGTTTGQANTKVLIRGLSVWCSIFTNLYAIDFRFLSAARAERSSCHIFAPTGVNTSSIAPYLKNVTQAAFTSSVGSGFAWPTGGTNADTTMDTCTSEGYECTYRVSDHFTASRLNSIYADVVVKWDSSQGVAGGTQHGIFIQNMTAEIYNGGLLTAGGACQVDINWDTEGVPSAYDINAGAELFGYFRFGDKVDNRSPVVTNGAPNLKIINVNVGSGHLASPPSVPLSTASATLVYRDATVVVHTGAGVTVSAITIDGTATSQTVAAASSSVPVRVPAGKTIALTYAGGTPTWDWWLD